MSDCMLSYFLKVDCFGLLELIVFLLFLFDELLVGFLPFLLKFLMQSFFAFDCLKFLVLHYGGQFSLLVSFLDMFDVLL